MRRATVLACTSCTDHVHCSECGSYSNSPIAFKANASKKVVKLSTYKRVSGFPDSLPIERQSMCSGCESKNCFGCTMYNTQFIQG